MNRDRAYAPSCSQGPGPNNHIFTGYALSARPSIAPCVAASQDVVLAAIQGHVLASTTRTVAYSRP